MLAFSLLSLLVFGTYLYASRSGRLTPLASLIYSAAMVGLGVLWLWFGITSLQ